MKNIALAIALILTVAACSSGTTIDEVPSTITGLYKGEFKSLNGKSDGSMILNIAQDADGDAVNGTLQIVYDKQNPTCLANTLVSGQVNGFTLALTAEFQGSGENAAGGAVNFQLTSSENTNVLSGTYVTTGDACSNFSGSGSVTLRK